MSRLRLAFFAAVCLASFLWASQVFLGLSVRFAHQGLVETIRAGKRVTDEKRIAVALNDYANAVNSLPCNAPLLSDLALLRAYSSDMALESSEEGGEAAGPGVVLRCMGSITSHAVTSRAEMMIPAAMRRRVFMSSCLPLLWFAPKDALGMYTTPPVYLWNTSATPLPIWCPLVDRPEDTAELLLIEPDRH